MRRVIPSTAARWSAGTAVVGVRGDEDLERRPVLADDAHAVPLGPRPQQRREPLRPLEAHADLEDPVPVVLGAELTDAAHAAKGELEPVPIIGRRQRCDHEVDLARTRRRARRRDRLRFRRVLVGQRLLDEIPLLAILARRQEARSRLRGDRRVVTGRRWGRDLLARRRRWRRLLGLGAAGSDACREVHDLLLVLALLLVVACHDAQRTAQAQVNATTIARIERATADAVARVRRRGPRAGVVRTASIAALSSSAVASLRSQPRASGRRRTSPCPSAALPERT